MLGIMLEITSISNQMCEKPSISKLWIWNTRHFDWNSRFSRNTRVFVWINRFSFEIAHLSCQNTKRESASAYIHTSYIRHVTPLYVFVLNLNDPTLAICVHATWMPPNYEKQRRKQTKNLYFVKIDQETSGKESDLPISSMEPTSSISKMFIDEWKIFFFVGLFTIGNIIGLNLELN